ncbi:hypothetical protein C8R47DRAFT_1071659 [Mycena vitilis]|nr:hypothetical protein C8R47DRAFT_1071659 [Mycena vitilis]
MFTRSFLSAEPDLWFGSANATALPQPQNRSSVVHAFSIGSGPNRGNTNAAPVMVFGSQSMPSRAEQWYVGISNKSNVSSSNSSSSVAHPKTVGRVWGFGEQVWYIPLAVAKMSRSNRWTPVRSLSGCGPLISGFWAEVGEDAFLINFPGFVVEPSWKAIAFEGDAPGARSTHISSSPPSRSIKIYEPPLDAGSKLATKKRLSVAIVAPGIPRASPSPTAPAEYCMSFGTAPTLLPLEENTDADIIPTLATVATMFAGNVDPSHTGFYGMNEDRYAAFPKNGDLVNLGSEFDSDGDGELGALTTASSGEVDEFLNSIETRLCVGHNSPPSLRLMAGKESDPVARRSEISAPGQQRSKAFDIVGDDGHKIFTESHKNIAGYRYRTGSTYCSEREVKLVPQPRKNTVYAILMLCPLTPQKQPGKAKDGQGRGHAYAVMCTVAPARHRVARRRQWPSNRTARVAHW